MCQNPVCLPLREAPNPTWWSAGLCLGFNGFNSGYTSESPQDSLAALHWQRAPAASTVKALGTTAVGKRRAPPEPPLSLPHPTPVLLHSHPRKCQWAPIASSLKISGSKEGFFGLKPGLLQGPQFFLIFLCPTDLPAAPTSARRRFNSRTTGDKWAVCTKFWTTFQRLKMENIRSQNTLRLPFRNKWTKLK